MAEDKAKTETKEAKPLPRKYRVQSGRVYRHNGHTYRGGAVLFLPPAEGDAASDELMPAEDAN